MIFVLMDFGAGMARLRRAVIFKTTFRVSYPNESEGTVSLGSSKIAIMYAID